MNPDKKPKVFLAIIVLASLYLIFSGPVFIQSLPVLLTQAFGILLIVWAVLSIKLNKHQEGIHTLPPGYYFITKGPYEIIRHPIYAGVLLLMFGFVQGAPSLWRYLALFILTAALLLKMISDENVMTDAVKEYTHYQKKTNRIIPFLF